LLVSGNPPATGKADAVSIGTLNTVTGALAGASYQATSVGSSWSEALAIGFDGLKGGNLSGSDGGLSPEILLRLDHQTESNFLFGAEISLSIPGGNGSSGSDTATYGLSSEEYTSPDLNIRRSVTVDPTALASARLRLGYAIGDYLAYGTGGLAYARYTATSTTTGSFNGAQVSQSLDETDDAFGGVIGGGISTFVADNAVVSIEALYYLFDAETEFDGGYGASASLDDAFSVMTTLSIRAY
jgi:opacity protein-like surface antigen